MLCGYASDNYNSGMAMLERRQVDPNDPEEGLKKLWQVLDTMHPLLGEKADKEKERLTEKYITKP
jgi:hypothetical protein